MRLIAAFVLTMLVSSTAAAQFGVVNTTPNQGERQEAEGERERPSWSWPLLWLQSITVNTVNRNAQLTYNPSYVWWLSTLPSWNFADDWNLGGRIGFSYEWTNSVEEEFLRAGFNGRDFMLDDIRVSVMYTVPKNPGGFGFSFRGDVRLPASEFSRSRERILSPGLTFTTNRPFKVMHGMNLAVFAAYWGWFARSNVAVTREDAFPCRTAPGAGGSPGESLDTCLGGATSVRHWTSAGIQYSFKPLKKFGIFASFVALWGKAFGLAEACVQTIGGEVCLGDESANDHWRTFTGFNFSLQYDFVSYLQGTLSYDTWAGYPDSDGSLENPFWNENSRIIFGLTFIVDQLYTDVKTRRAERRARESAVASTD